MTSMFKRKIKVPVPKVHVSSTTRHFSVRQLLVFALIFAALGGYLIWHSFAVTPIVGSVQAEAMTLPTGADIVSDSSASGGQAVRFSQDGTATSALSLSSQATSLAVTLKGMKCRGDVPHYTLSISTTGATPSNIFTVNGSAGSSGWSNVTTNKTIDAGNYNLSFTVSNSLSANNCNRDLYLDVVTFYGPAPATTALSFSGSPTTVSAGGSALLNWSATNATSCTASGAWSGDKPTSGSNVSTGALNATSTYKLTCAGADGTSTSQSVTISVALSTTSKSIYWGAIMDGDQTYAFYYGPMNRGVIRVIPGTGLSKTPARKFQSATIVNQTHGRKPRFITVRPTSAQTVVRSSLWTWLPAQFPSVILRPANTTPRS
jgi:hypothetical protein